MIIEWESADAPTKFAEVPGGKIVLFSQYEESGTGAPPSMSAAMVFVPDPRIALAGQIIASQCNGLPAWIKKSMIDDLSTYVEQALMIADEILKQASEKN